MRLAEIRPRHVAAFVRDQEGRAAAAAAIARDLSVLHAVFKTAVREELIDRNPAEAAERPKVIPRRWRILEPAEVAACREGVHGRSGARRVHHADPKC